MKVLSLFLSPVFGFVPATITYEELLRGDKSTVDIVAHALKEVGMFSVSQMKTDLSLDFNPEEVLTSSAKCSDLLDTESEDYAKMIKFLEDGTQRRTFAAESGNQVWIPDSIATDPHCALFRDQEQEFRAAVESASSAFADILDKIVSPDRETHTKLFLDTETGSHFTSFREIFDTAPGLDHFHTYSPKSSSHTDSDMALDFHIDQGMFLTLAPAVSVAKSGVSRDAFSFLVQSANGQVVSPDLAGSDIVFMAGEGLASWTGAATGLFRAVPHALKSPKMTRAWFGRMQLLKPSLLIPAYNKVFSELREFKREASTLCQTEVMNSRILQDCEEDEIYCWSQCQPVLDDCAETLCTHLVDGTSVECPEDAHLIGIHDCAPECAPVETDSPTASPTVEEVTPGSGAGTDSDSVELKDFCSGLVTNMFMQGFTGLGQRNECVVFLFPNFLLDSEGKFAAGFFLAALLAIVAEGIVYLRRKATAGTSENQYVKIGLYLVQVTIGYFAMLIAMTYSVYLFLAVIFGYMIGHRVFNYNIGDKEEEKKKDCCHDEEEEEAKPAEPKAKKSCCHDEPEEEVKLNP